jgi:hypothetical protein
MSNVIEAKNRGGKIANPSAVKPNMVSAIDADQVGVNAKRDEVTLTTAGNFTAFVFDGVTTTLDTPIAVASVAAIKTALEAVVGLKENNVWISVEYAGGDLTIKHDGQLRLASVACSDVSAGAQQATTLKATLASLLKYSTSAVGAISPLTIGGTTVALANTPYAHTGTPATDDATAATLATDLDTALAAAGATVVIGAAVTRNDIDSDYDITFTIQYVDDALILAGTQLAPVDSYSSFVA